MCPTFNIGRYTLHSPICLFHQEGACIAYMSEMIPCPTCSFQPLKNIFELCLLVANSFFNKMFQRKSLVYSIGMIKSPSPSKPIIRLSASRDCVNNSSTDQPWVTQNKIPFLSPGEGSRCDARWGQNIEIGFKGAATRNTRLGNANPCLDSDGEMLMHKKH